MWVGHFPFTRAYRVFVIVALSQNSLERFVRAHQSGMEVLFRSLDNVVTVDDPTSRAARREILLRCIRSKNLALRLFGMKQLLSFTKQATTNLDAMVSVCLLCANSWKLQLMIGCVRCPSVSCCLGLDA